MSLVPAICPQCGAQLTIDNSHELQFVNIAERTLLLKKLFKIIPLMFKALEIQ